MSYSRSDTVKILRSTHKVELRKGMTRGAIKLALDNVPVQLTVTYIEDKDDGSVVIEFLDERTEAQP